MKLNLILPVGAASDPAAWAGNGGIGEMAAAAEAAGFRAISVTDHPFPDDSFIAAGGHHAFDPFVALSFAAAATTQVRVMTYVVVAGYRNPYLLANSVASLDTLSGGRLTLGLAVGYLESEFAVLGADFRDRGARFDAALAAMAAAWTGASVSHDSEYFPAHGRTMRPRPAQRPHPPIWIGGNSNRAVARAVECGDGWMPWPATKTFSRITRSPAVQNFDTLAARIEMAQNARLEAGRNLLEVAFAPFGSTAVDVEAHNWQRIAESSDDYARAGVTWLNLQPRAKSFDRALAEIAEIGRAFA